MPCCTPTPESGTTEADTARTSASRCTAARNSTGPSGKCTTLLQDALAEVGEDGGVRCDVPPAELAGYCLHALAAAGVLPSEAAVDRLVEITLAGLRPP